MESRAYSTHSRGSLLVRASDSWSKSCEFESRAEAAGEFSSPELILCSNAYSVSVPPPVLPQWHAKDPGHSAKSVGCGLHLNTHTSLTQRTRSRLTMPLCKHSVGTYQETNSHATSQGTEVQNTQEIKRMLFNEMEQDKTCTFSM